MKRGGVALAVFLMLAGFGHARDLYWTEQKKILASDIDGGNVAVIFDGETSSPAMESYAVDIQVTDDHIYWSGHSGGDIWRADRDGGNPVRLVSGTGSTIHSFEVDEEAGKIYFSDFEVGRLREVNLSDGGGLATTIMDNYLWKMTGLVMDRSSPAGSRRMFGVTTNDSFVYAMQVEDWGGYISDSRMVPGSSNTYGVAHDPVANRVYYTDFGSNEIYYYDFGLAEGDVLWTPGMKSPLGVKLSPGGTHLLIAERGRGISAYEIATGGYELLFGAPDVHFGVAVTADPGSLRVPEPPLEADPDVLFVTDFEQDFAGGHPAQGWYKATRPQDGTMMVVQDEENVFGAGTENNFLRVVSGRHFGLYAAFEPTEVVTLSFEYIAREYEGDSSRAFNFNLGTAYGNEFRVHVAQVNSVTGRIDARDVGAQNVPHRFDLIVNNSTEQISYEKPDGTGTGTLNAGRSALWRYDFAEKSWDRLRNGYNNHRSATVSTGEGMTEMWVQIDSNEALRSFDLDNIMIFRGATPGKYLRDSGGPVDEGFAGWQAEHFPGVSDAEVIGAAADPDGDGIPNLLEYLLGSDPTVASRGNLPVSSIGAVTVEGAESDYLMLTFTVSDDAAAEVGYQVETADEVGNWSAGGVLVESVSNGDGTTTLTYRDDVPFDSGTRRFMRLSVNE